MSLYFVAEDGQELWNPTTLGGKLFCDQVASLARELGVESGLETTGAALVVDEVVISRTVFFRFVRELLTLRLRTTETSAAGGLLAGCFGISLALAQKLGFDQMPQLTASAFEQIEWGRQAVG